MTPETLRGAREIERQFLLDLAAMPEYIAPPDRTNYRPAPHVNHRGERCPPIGSRAEQERIAMDPEFREQWWQYWSQELGLTRRPAMFKPPRGHRARQAPAPAQPQPRPVDDLVAAVDGDPAQAAELVQLVSAAMIQRVATDRKFAMAMVKLFREAAAAA